MYIFEEYIFNEFKTRSSSAIWYRLNVMSSSNSSERIGIYPSASIREEKTIPLGMDDSLSVESRAAGKDDSAEQLRMVESNVRTLVTSSRQGSRGFRHVPASLSLLPPPPPALNLTAETLKLNNGIVDEIESTMSEWESQLSKRDHSLCEKLSADIRVLDDGRRRLMSQMVSHAAATLRDEMLSVMRLGNIYQNLDVIVRDSAGRVMGVQLLNDASKMADGTEQVSVVQLYRMQVAAAQIAEIQLPPWITDHPRYSTPDHPLGLSSETTAITSQPSPTTTKDSTLAKLLDWELLLKDGRKAELLEALQALQYTEPLEVSRLIK